MKNIVKHRKYDITCWIAIQKEKLKTREKMRLELLKKIIKKLKNYFMAKDVEEVYLTGSIIEEGKFYPFSDIDIAVRGMKEDYFKIYGDMEDIAGRNIDLIELERCRFKDFITHRSIRIK